MLNVLRQRWTAGMRRVDVNYGCNGDDVRPALTAARSKIDEWLRPHYRAPLRWLLVRQARISAARKQFEGEGGVWGWHVRATLFFWPRVGQ
jgi:hypothetical protein